MKSRIFLSVVSAFIICCAIVYNITTVSAVESKSVPPYPNFNGTLLTYGTCETLPVPLSDANYIVEDRNTNEILASGVTKDDGKWYSTAPSGHLIRVTFTKGGKVTCLHQVQSQSGNSNIVVCMSNIKGNSCQDEE